MCRVNCSASAYQSLPFLVDDISGSRALALFLVEDGASMILRRLHSDRWRSPAHFDQGARAQRDALVGKVTVHLGEDRLRQPVPLQQVAEVQDGEIGRAHV